MKIADYLRDDLIFLDIDASDKEEAIVKTIQAMSDKGVLKDVTKFLKEVIDREALGSTAIGEGVAFPHARTQYVNGIVIAFSRLKNGVNFDAADNKPVRLIFLMGTPIQKVSEYLKVLAELSKQLRIERVRKTLLEASDPLQVGKAFHNTRQNFCFLLWWGKA